VSYQLKPCQKKTDLHIECDSLQNKPLVIKEPFYMNNKDITSYNYVLKNVTDEVISHDLGGESSPVIEEISTAHFHKSGEGHLETN